MKETLIDLVTRRSCRAYKKEQISEDWEKKKQERQKRKQTIMNFLNKKI